MVEHSSPYPRLPAPAAFGAPKVIDLELLRRLWAPWVSLEYSSQGHMLANGAAIAYSQLQQSHGDSDLLRPWTQVHAPGGLRALVMKQLRLETETESKSDGELSKTGSKLSRFEEDFPGLMHEGGRAALMAVSTAGSLTATSTLSSYEMPAWQSDDWIRQHHVFEQSKFLRIREPANRDLEGNIKGIARGRSDPMLRIMVAIHLATYEVRLGGNAEDSQHWVGVARSAYDECTDRPTWLRALAMAHLGRLEALILSRTGRPDHARGVLEEIYSSGHEVVQSNQELPAVGYWALEAQSLHLGVRIRLAARTGESVDAVQNCIDALDLIDPYATESRSAIALLYENNGRLPEAAAEYLKAAQGGAALGARAAFDAYKIYVNLRRRSEAAKALDFLVDLDPAADVDQIISQGAW